MGVRDSALSTAQKFFLPLKQNSQSCAQAIRGHGILITIDEWWTKQATADSKNDY